MTIETSNPTAALSSDATLTSTQLRPLLPLLHILGGILRREGVAMVEEAFRKLELGINRFPKDLDHGVDNVVAPVVLGKLGLGI